MRHPVQIFRFSDSQILRSSPVKKIKEKSLVYNTHLFMNTNSNYDPAKFRGNIRCPRYSVFYSYNLDRWMTSAIILHKVAFQPEFTFAFKPHCELKYLANAL